MNTTKYGNGYDDTPSRDGYDSRLAMCSKISRKKTVTLMHVSVMFDNIYFISIKNDQQFIYLICVLKRR